MVNLISQNDKRLHPKIQSFGCRFRCLLAMVEISLQKSLTVDQINEIYYGLIKSEDTATLNKNCSCGRTEHILTKIAASYLEGLKGFRQFGIYENNQGYNWDGTKLIFFDFILNHWGTYTTDGHYTLSSAKNNLLFDPWDYEKGKNDGIHLSLSKYPKRAFVYKAIQLN